MLTMIIGTILAPRISNLTAITKATKRKKGHRTSLGRFLVAKGLDTFGLLMRLFMGVLAHTLKFLSEQKNLPIYLIIDSTIQERASLNVAGSQVIRLSGGSYGPGQLLMVGVVRVGQFTLPFWIEPVFNKHWAKVLKRPRRTQIQIAEEMIRTFLPPAEMEVIVLFDSFFSAQKILKACEARGFTFVTNLKSNRKVLAHRNQNQVGKYAANVLARNHSAYVFGRQTFLAATRDSAIKGFGKIRVVFSRKVGHKRIYHLATNDTTASIKEIIGHYLRRWAIETFFKDVKHHLGMADYPARTLDGGTNYVRFVYMGHLLLTFHQLERMKTGKTETKRASSPAEIRSDLRTRFHAYHLKRTLKRRKIPVTIDQIQMLLAIET